MVDSIGSSPLRVDAVWDIETADWDTFVSGAVWVAGQGVRIFRDEDDMAEALLTLPKGATAWAHAGGRFDVLWLLDWCHRNDMMPKAQIRMSGSAISSLSITGGPTFRDSYRLVPMSLKKAGGMFGGARKQELSLPCCCDQRKRDRRRSDDNPDGSCGGFCSISRTMPNDLRLRLEEYLVADVESLRDVLLGLVEFTAANRLELRGTVASSSWASAKLHCELEDTDWDLRAYRFARQGYKGGRVEVARTRASHVYRYDRSAAYPAALQEPVPCGELRLCNDSKRAWGCFTRDRPGIYAAAVDVPELRAGLLPVKVGERMAYPVGLVRGVWPLAELRYAVSCGARVREVTSAIVWEREEPILKPYMKWVWDLRAAAMKEQGEKSPRGAWLKWLANSLTGAFAQDPEQQLFTIGDKADDPRWHSVGVYDWLWQMTKFRIAARAHVHYAATLTANARVELLEQIRHAGDAWVYSDTDSCIATKRLTRNVGNDLGEWKFEGEGWQWHAIAPKVYRYETEKAPVVKAKGVPDAEHAWPELLRGERVANDSGVKSFLQAVRVEGRIFTRAHTSKRLAEETAWVGARLRDGDSTRPPTMDDLRELPK